MTTRTWTMKINRKYTTHHMHPDGTLWESPGSAEIIELRNLTQAHVDALNKEFPRAFTWSMEYSYDELTHSGTTSGLVRGLQQLGYEGLNRWTIGDLLRQVDTSIEPPADTASTYEILGAWCADFIKQTRG